VKRRTSARFELVNKKSFDLSQVRKLGAVAMSQVRDTLAIRRGEAFDTFDECLAAARELFGDDDVGLTRYDIVPAGKKKPTHELWVYLEEHGVVFEHGSADATPVHCVQRHFFSTDPDDAASVAFAEALDDVRWR